VCLLLYRPLTGLQNIDSVFTFKDRKKDLTYKVKATSETENLPESSSDPDANVLFSLEDFDTPCGIGTGTDVIATIIQTGVS